MSLSLSLFSPPTRKLPTLLLARPDGHEAYHGRIHKRDLFTFVAEALQSRLTALYERDFPQRVLESPEAWFVDFYAPWCPPCKKMLPEFRRASLQVQDINFGSVNCEALPMLCNQFHITSYPTAVLYNGSSAEPHLFSGDIFNSGSFVMFATLIRQPPVVEISPASFEEHVIGNKGQAWVSVARNRARKKW